MTWDLRLMGSHLRQYFGITWGPPGCKGPDTKERHR